MGLIQVYLIALIAAVAFGSLLLYYRAQRAAEQVRVLRVIAGSAAASIVVKDKDVRNNRRAEIAGRLRDERAESEGAKRVTLSSLIMQAGLSISVSQYWIFSAISSLIFVGLSVVFGCSLFVNFMAAVIGLLGFPKIVLKRLAARRQKAFLEEFADGLEAMIRLLKAGMPISEAVAMISREFEGPLGEEMSIIYDKQKIGIPLYEAALEMMERMPLAEVKMFSTGLAIQAQTGASMSEVLQNLANVIRARFKLKRKIKALSSEAVASASIIGALPILVASGMYFVNYDYLSVLFETPFGNVLLGGAIFWMCCGISVMKIMINFRI